MVYGSRFLARRGRAQSWGHWLANRFLTALSNVFTGLRLTDMETGFKVIRREVLEAVAPTLKQDRFGIEPELTAKAARRGYRFREVAIGYVGRTRAEGKKLRWRDGVQALWCIVRYWRWQ